MRTFTEIERELGLMPFVESANGDLFCVPVAPGAPRVLVRRFDRDLPPELIPAYVDLLAAAGAWIEADPELATGVCIEQPLEVGRDFIARRHLLGTSIAAYLDPDPDEDPEELPPELVAVQGRFRARTEVVGSLREALLAQLLARSLLEPTAKTLFVAGDERLIIADLKPTRAELERWRELEPV